MAISSAYDQATSFDRARARDPYDGRPSREKAVAAALEEKLGVKAGDVSDELNKIRRIKQPEEIDALRRAAQAGAAALVEAMRASEPGVGEWQIDALMTFVHVREGAEGPAYHGIVASGPNSCSLHYLTSSRTMEKGDVILIDYGPEVDHYVTDITRTWPVDGKWTERQAELYDVVLEAQQAGIAAVKPGVTMAQVSAVCDGVLREHGMIGMRPHPACHYVGMEVHDPGGYRVPLEPGAVITVEPGLYDRKLGIGIRIEDTVVVTADGCEVLSEGVPKERAAIDALIEQEGLLRTLNRRAE
ncbi:MAG: M24 family metallopeptidase [Planctomycetota bacterium]|nr:M24 family metallopeptidase [Planctomycetota bacterium]